MSGLEGAYKQSTCKRDAYKCNTIYDDDFYVKKIELPEFGIKVVIERDTDGNYDTMLG